MNIKAIVMDMDGTLLNSKDKISPKTKDALIECQKNGIKIVLASGRNYGRIKPYLEELHLEEFGGLLIEINGIAIYDMSTNQRTILRQMHEDEVHPVFSYLMNLNAESIAVYDEGLFDYMPDHILTMKHKLRLSLDLPEDYPWTAGAWSWLWDMRNGYPCQKYIEKVEEIDCPINKFQILQETDILNEIEKKLIHKYGDHFEVFRTTPRQIEMGPKGYTKGDTLARLMKNFGWSKDEAFVFGDGGNDISMFKQTNYSFAMGQALESVKNEARYITLSNDEDGIYEALMKFNVIKGV